MRLLSNDELMMISGALSGPCTGYLGPTEVTPSRLQPCPDGDTNWYEPANVWAFLNGISSTANGQFYYDFINGGQNLCLYTGSGKFIGEYQPASSTNYQAAFTVDGGGGGASGGVNITGPSGAGAGANGSVTYPTGGAFTTYWKPTGR